jgi:hypothetical protein
MDQIKHLLWIPSQVGAEHHLTCQPGSSTIQFKHYRCCQQMFDLMSAAAFRASSAVILCGTKSGKKKEEWTAQLYTAKQQCKNGSFPQDLNEAFT